MVYTLHNIMMAATILCFNLYSYCPVFDSSTPEGIEAMKRFLLQLPKVNFDVLKYIW